jgi:hypothetical protein
MQWGGEEFGVWFGLWYVQEIHQSCLEMSLTLIFLENGNLCLNDSLQNIYISHTE